MSSYIVKENHNGSVVSEIFRYRQTHIDILLLHYKDILINNVNKIFEFSENKYRLHTMHRCHMLGEIITLPALIGPKMFLG